MSEAWAEALKVATSSHPRWLQPVGIVIVKTDFFLKEP